MTNNIMTQLLTDYPTDALTHATIDAICTLMIPLLDTDSFTESECFDLLRIIDDRMTDNDDMLYDLNLAMLSTIRDNTDFKMLI